MIDNAVGAKPKILVDMTHLYVSDATGESHAFHIMVQQLSTSEIGLSEKRAHSRVSELSAAAIPAAMHPVCESRSGFRPTLASARRWPFDASWCWHRSPSP